MIEILEDLALKQLKTLQHGFLMRQGGVSKGDYASLNCADDRKDDPANAQENRRRVADYFGFPLEALATVKNVHGNQVVLVEKSWSADQSPKADGMVTQQRGILLGLNSADCPIVFFADELSGTIGLAHAGWRGAKGGVLEATLKLMMSVGADPAHISAAISPCIMQASYEVSDEFCQFFLMDTVDNKKYFQPSIRSNHFLFDLPGYIKNRLSLFNLKLISDNMVVDTYTDEKHFFSHRRATHQGTDTGRHLSCIHLL